MPTDASSARRKRNVRLILGILCVVTALSANLLLTPFGVDAHPAWYYIPRAIVFGTGVALLIRYCRLASETGHATYGTAKKQKPSTDLVSASLAIADEVEQSRLRRVVDREVAFEFAQRFLSPAVTRARIAESISLHNDRVFRSSTIEFLPEMMDEDYPIETFGFEHASAVRLVPVVRFNKGQLVSNLEIRDSTGQVMPTLPHGEYLVLCGLCIFALLGSAIADPSTTTQREKYAEVQTLLLSRAISAATLDQAEAAAKTSELIEFISKKLTVVSVDDLTLLCSFVTRTQIAYAIVVEAEISRDRHAMFQLSYIERLTSTPSKTSEASVRSRLRNTVREWSGLDPNSLYIDVSRTKKCASYHIEIEAPDGYYVGETWFHDHSTMKPVPVLEPQAIYQSSQPYFRCPKPSGQSFAHLYTRSFQHSDALAPCLYIRFFEKLPGSIGKAWILAAAVLAIVWIFGASWDPNPQVGGVKSPLGGIDPGALIFALPLALWALIGLGEKSRGYASTLASQASIVLSLAISFLALVLTLFIAADRIPAKLAWPSVALVTHPGWILLLGIAAINFCWISEKLLVRFWKWKRVQLPANVTFNTTP